MRDQRSPEAQRYRRLYNTARWRSVVEQQRRVEPVCRMCMAMGRLTPMYACDHIDPKTKDDVATFFSGPFQSLCRTHHNSTKQREEKRGYSVGCDASGKPIDPAHPWNAV